MRTGPRILLAVVIAIVVFAVLLVATPLGWRLGLPLARRALRQRTGLELSIGSVSGSPLSRLVLSDVTLSDPESCAGGVTGTGIGTDTGTDTDTDTDTGTGTDTAGAGASPGVLFSASSLVIHYDLQSLRRGAPIIHELVMDGVELTLDVNAGGALSGWGRLASGETAVVADDTGSPKWTLGRAAVSDLHVLYTNDAADMRADAIFSELEASGTQDELDVRLAAAGTFAHPTLTEPVHARLDAAGRLRADVVELESLALEAGSAAAVGAGSGSAAGDVASAAGAENALDLNARGTLAISPDGPLRLALGGRMDAREILALLAAASEAPPASGLLDVSGTLEGGWTSLIWTAAVTSPSITVAGMSAEAVAVHAAGTTDTIVVDHLAARALGGRVEARGAVVLAGTVPFVRGEGKATGIHADRLPDLPMQGEIDLAFGGSMAIGDLRSLDAIVDAEGRGLRVESGGEAKTINIGTARVHTRASGGRFSGSLSTRGATAEFDGVLTDVGVESIAATATADDLASALAGLVPVDLRGRVRASVRSDRPMDGFTFIARADAESLAVGSMLIGKASLTAVGDPADMAGSFSAFDDDASGTWRLAYGDMSVDALLDSFELAGELAVAPGRSLELTGSTSGRVAFEATRGGAYDLTAELAALTVESAGENLRLVAPVVIEASPDSVRVHGLRLAGTLGSVSLDGVFVPAGRTDVSAVLDNLRLESVVALANSGETGPDIRGLVNGVGAFSMSDGALELDANMSAVGLVVNGIRVGDIDLDAESDAADLIFELVSVSDAGGRITALGSLPYASDSTRVFSLETDREFAATVICSSYVFEAGPAFLPGIRGRKQFILSGSALVAGRADSLGSINGAGRFSEARAAWGFVSFALADPFEFSVADGAVEMERLSVDVARQRALGPESGGRIDISGRVERDGGLTLTARTADLDVAHISRAFTPGVTPRVTGILTADAVVGGTLDVPSLTFSWDLAEPALSGMRFDALRGSGSADPYVLELTSAELVLGTSVMTASGVIPLQRAQGPALHAGMYAGVSEMDIAVRAERFRVNRTQGLPKGVSRLGGTIDADVRLRGAPEAPEIEGVVTISDGRIDLEQLEQGIRNIEMRISGSGGKASLETATARVGAGTLTATGTMQTNDGGGFRMGATLKDVDVAVKEVVDARLSGSLNWAGTASSSLLKGRVTIDDATVTYKAGLADLLTRRPRTVVVARTSGPLSTVALDIAADIVEPVRVRSNLADMELAGGIRAGGTLAEPSLSGGVSSEEGSIWYLGQEFLVERLSVVYSDPRRRVPFVDVAGTATVESSSGDEYVVTVRYQGFAGETVPELTSVPMLSEPDIAALLTFGETMGALTSGGSSGSAGESFGALARSAFVGGLFGVAETTARRWLNLDTVDVSGASLDDGGLADAQVTFGKRFGRRLSVDYTTELGGFSGQTVGLSWRLTDEVSIETKANQEGNHAIGLKFRYRFE